MPGEFSLKLNDRVVVIFNDCKRIITVNAYVYSRYETRDDNMYVIDTEKIECDSKTPYSFAVEVSESEINKVVDINKLPSFDEFLYSWSKNTNFEFDPAFIFVYTENQKELIIEAQSELQSYIQTKLLSN